MIAQAVVFDFRIGEISCPTKYFDEASSISFRRSLRYGFGVLATTLRFAAHQLGVASSRIFETQGRNIGRHYYKKSDNLYTGQVEDLPETAVQPR
jgi:hypothetical protein